MDSVINFHENGLARCIHHDRVIIVEFMRMSSVQRYKFFILAFLSLFHVRRFFRQTLITSIIYAQFFLFGGPVSAQQNATKLGNPLLARFPTSSDSINSLARSIWDMHYFHDKIYLGHGDYWTNSGPTDIWVYQNTGFAKEFTVDDEMIWSFFEFEDKLFIPGNDATEDWAFANLYINDPNRKPNPGWIKLRTLSGGLHSFDIALFKGRLFASISTGNNMPPLVLVSRDMGRTWSNFLSEYCSFVVFDDFMFINGENNYRYDGVILRSVTTDFTISLPLARKVKFLDGLLYSKPLRYALENCHLYFLPRREIKDDGRATIITKFVTDKVRDIVVRDETCYVMTAKEIRKDSEYMGYIYSSNDLENWFLAAEFLVPGIPLSFELMNGKIYVGLGCRYDVGSGICIGPESGSIWETSPITAHAKDCIKYDQLEYKLYANYPNPFNPATHISFSIPHISNVMISIYNIQGHLVDIIYDQETQIGYHTVRWDASKLGAGTYFIHFRTRDFYDIRRCVLLK